MLKRHFDFIEKLILAQSKVVDEAGHSIHKGTPREFFIREFLEKHMGERAAFSTGEIIDSDSNPSESRNQIDIIIYRPDYPKLNLGGGINVFVAESVLATIEVKSKLDEEKLKKSIKAAERIKKLKREVTGVRFGYVPPGIVSYLVAYDGPSKMKTVYGWLDHIHKEEGISVPELSLSRSDRLKKACPSIDAVFILGKGFLYFDNQQTGYTSNKIHKEHPETKWIYADSQDGNIYLLFIFLTDIVCSFMATIPRLTPYLGGSPINLMHGG